jgi:hypothetical protein
MEAPVLAKTEAQLGPVTVVLDGHDRHYKMLNTRQNKFWIRGRLHPKSCVTLPRQSWARNCDPISGPRDGYQIFDDSTYLSPHKTSEKSNKDIKEWPFYGALTRNITI